MVGKGLDPASRLSSPVEPSSSEGRGSDGPTQRLELAVWELSAERGGLDRVEDAVEEISAARLERWFTAHPEIQEIGRIRTCRRLLVLAVSEGSDPLDRLASSFDPERGWERFRGEGAIHHLFRITAGLESLAPGEREVREQVRRAAASVRSRHPRPLIRPLLEDAIANARRTEAPEAVSIADLAVDWLLPRLRGPDPEVVVVGTGRVGRRVAERLAGYARVTMMYHHEPPGAEWVERSSARLLPAPLLRTAIASADALVAAAKASGRIVSLDDLPEPGSPGPSVFVDLGVPRNIDPAVSERPGTELVDLSGIPQGRLPAGRIAEMERTISRAASASSAGFARAAVEPWVTRLYREGDRIRREELARALAFAGELSEPARLALERLSRRVVGRSLSGPAAELRSIPPDPEYDAARQLLLDRMREPTGL